MTYEIDSKGKQETKVIIDGEEPMSLREYLDEKIDSSQHELIRRNVLNATRNYTRRVKSLINNIVLDKHNPMDKSYYSKKVVLQGREADHNHGVLWADLKKMEYYFEDESNESEHQEKKEPEEKQN